MSQENVELAWQAVQAWNEGGAEAILPYLDPEVEWHPPRESMEPGTRGHAGVRDYLGRLAEVFSGAQRAEPVDVIDVDAERVITVIRLIAQSEKFGTEIDAEWAWLIKGRDGKGIEVWTFTDRSQALEAAGLRGVGLARRSYLATLPRMNDAAPILIAYDGSDTARRAVHEAAELFGSRRALVVTVWEPGLAYEVGAMTADPTGLGPEPVDSGAAQEVDDASKGHADRVAEDGAALAKSLGVQAEALAVADEGNVADAIVELARKRGVAAVVVGSRGLTGLRARLEGSTSNAVAKHASCPVVLVHGD